MQTEYEQSADEKIKFLENELHKRETEIALLKETSDDVASELHFDRVLSIVAERAQKLIGSETLLIPILDAARSQYTYRAGCGMNAAEIVGECLPLSLGICGWVFRHKRPWWRGVIEELSAEERNQWEHEAGTVILVPLIGKRHFLGGIAGINKIGGGEFSKRDLDILSMFASQVAIAIENAGYFTELNDSKKQLETYQTELKSLNTELEERVQTRTAELAALNSELRRLALYDSLTGLANRSLILDRLQQCIHVSTRENKPFSIIMMDLDRFKEINDTLGHNMGDELLRSMAQRIENALRKSDTVGRWGGDEFVVVTPGAGSANAIRVATKIQRALEPAFTLDRRQVSMTASLGIAEYPIHGQDVASLLKCADVAMYVAKRTKSGCSVYDPQSD